MTRSEKTGTVRLAPVSVIIPCYRCADTIAEAVYSVFAQTLRPAEVLLVDDGSGDGTLGELQRVGASYPPGWIRIFTQSTNGGPSRARNIGWQHATKDYIAFLDADDTWTPFKIELQMATLDADPAVALISHRMRVQGRAESPPMVRPPVRAITIGRRRLLFNNPFQTPSVMLRRDLPFRFDENFRRVEDFLLWAQIVFSGYRCVKLNQTLALCHKASYGAGGLSGDLDAMHRAGREVGRELLRQGLVSRPEHYFARGIGALRRARRNLLMLGRRCTGKLNSYRRA